MKNAKILTQVLVLLVTVGATAPAIAEKWPTRPITIVVPFPAGGITDTVARHYANFLKDEYGQPVVVQNKPGAGAVIGTEYVSRSKPDGYTLLVSAPHHVINQAIRPVLPYDAIKDFTPISVLVSTPMVLIVANSSPIKSIDQYIQEATKRNGGISYGSSGVGSTSHLSGAMLGLHAKIPLTHIPYQGAMLATQDIIGGQLESAFMDESMLRPFIAEKLVRPIAIASAQRSEMLTDIPTTGELGYPSLDISTWMGLYAPAGTPAEITQKLNDVATRGMTSAPMKEWLLKSGTTFTAMSLEQASAFNVAELTKWQHTARETGVQVN